MANPERTAALVARPMRILSRVAAPAVWLLKHSTDAVLALLRLGGAREATVTEEEVKALIAEGTQAGVFAPQEREMIDGVLRLADRTVRAVMTPRLDIVWIDRAAGRDELVAPGRDAPPPPHPRLRGGDRPCRRLHRHGRRSGHGAPRRRRSTSPALCGGRWWSRRGSASSA